MQRGLNWHGLGRMEKNMKQCDTCGASDIPTEFAWLIEGDGNYWDGHYADSRSFTRDADRAIRFVRWEDAEAVKHWLLQANAFALRTVKHGWSNGVHK